MPAPVWVPLQPMDQLWAPGGLGVREIVFVATMQATLPHDVRKMFNDPATLRGLLVLLGFLLGYGTDLILTWAGA